MVNSTGNQTADQIAGGLGKVMELFTPIAGMEVGQISFTGLGTLAKQAASKFPLVEKSVERVQGGIGSVVEKTTSTASEIRQRITDNILKSKAAREASQFDEYIKKERDAIQLRGTEGTGELDFKEWADMPVSGQDKFAPNGQRLISIRDLKRFTKDMNAKDIKVVIDEKGKILPDFAAGGFDPKTGQIVIRKDPTYLSAIHESYHAKQWLEVGKEEYLKLSTLEREEYVYNQIMKNKDQFTHEEMLFSQRYIFKLRNGEWPPPDWNGFE